MMASISIVVFVYEPLERFEVKNLRLPGREGKTKGIL
jgi:hypothetical protein